MRPAFVIATLLACSLVASACSRTVSPRESSSPSVASEERSVVSAKQLEAEIVACGEIESSQRVGTASAPDTDLGYVHVMHELEQPRFKPGCPEIRARRGDRFGIQVIVRDASGASIVPLETRVTHPLIRNPRAKTETTVDSWASPMNIGIPRFTGWSFDAPWEVVAGEWRFELLDRGRVIASKTFQVSVERK